jgi:hypothetical protein
MTMDFDRWLQRLARATEFDAQEPERAPGRLKSRIYSALVNRQSNTGRLLSLSATKEAGGELCIFEAAVAALPVGERVKSMNPCRVCHARVLGERLEHAPIFWPHCPYSEFHHS